MTGYPKGQRDHWVAEQLIDRMRVEMFKRQDRKWGWPRPDSFLVGDHSLVSYFIWGEQRARCLFGEGKPSWMAILSEELGEVARATGEKRVTELIEAAAVNLSWAQAELEALKKVLSCRP